MPLTRLNIGFRHCLTVPLSKSRSDATDFVLCCLTNAFLRYLNAKASEEEGLYRVSGSARDIKHWQVRFDTGE